MDSLSDCEDTSQVVENSNKTEAAYFLCAKSRTKFKAIRALNRAESAPPLFAREENNF